MENLSLSETEKLLSDIATTAKPQSPSSLGGSKASLRACSTRIRSDQRVDHLKGSDCNVDKEQKKGSDQYQTTRESEFDIHEKLSDIITTAKPQLPSKLSIAKHLRSSSKMRFLHKRTRRRSSR